MKCAVKSAKFVKDLQAKVEEKKLTENQVVQILEQLDSTSFKQWYGKGEVDSFGYPKLVENLWIINGDKDRIKIYDLQNSEAFEKATKINEKINELIDVKKFLNEQAIGLQKRISAFKGTKYAEELDNLLKEVNALHENNVTEALTLHTKYILETIKKFENRLHKYEDVNIENLTKEELEKREEDYFNFLLEAKQFTETFEKVTQLPKPLNNSKLTSVLNQLRHSEARVSDLKNTLEKETTRIWKERLQSFSTNPQIVNGALDFLSAQEDESGAQRWLDSLSDSHHPVLASIAKKYRRQMDYARTDSIKQSRAWKEWCEKEGLTTENAFNKFVDENGKLLDEFDYEGYLEALKEAKKPMIELEESGKKFKADGKTLTPEFTKALNDYSKWKRANTRMPYVDEYYKVLDSLIPEAREAYSEISDKKSDLLEKGLNNLTIEDFKALKSFEEEMRWLKSSVYRDGTKKQGKDKEIADNLFKYSQGLSRFYTTVGIDNKAFEKAKEKAAKRGKLDEFLEQNLEEKFSQEFWNKFNAITSKLHKYEEVEEIKGRISQLLLGYKDSNGINTSNMPTEILEEYDKLNELKNAVYASIEKSDIEGQQELKKQLQKLIQFVPSKNYTELLASKKTALANNEITKEEYNNWYNANHEYDEFLEEYSPIRIHTKMQPKNKKHIEQAPKGIWQISTLKAEFYNTKGSEPYWNITEKGIYEPITNDNGFPLPKNQWANNKYDALNEKEKEQLLHIKTTLHDLIKHTNYQQTINDKTVTLNDSIVGKGYIPAIEKYQSVKKGGKKEFTEKAITEANDVVKFIPFQYMKKLNQQELPKLVDGMTEEEKERVTKSIEEIKKANKLAHGEAINRNLYETMGQFITAANNNRRKLEMKLDVDATIAQFKHLKIKQKTARGNTMYDKIASKATGNEVEYEKEAIDSNAYKHLLDWVDGVFYEDFNLDEGALTEWATKIQNVSSVLGIGFNALSAINNKIVGNIQLKIEAAGSQYFNYKELTQARKEYFFSQTNLIAEHGKDKSNILLTGLMKEFDVLQSQDELAGKPNGKMATVLHKIKMVKNAAYFMQHIGEHQIQNTSLITMLNSHRVINGKIMSYFEYASQFDVSADVKKMEAEGKTPSEILNWIKENKKDSKSTREEFEKYSKVIDEYELVNGYAQLKENSVLTKEQISDFRQRVIGINQKLHGIYNVEDAAMVQRYALGRLGMQFRKWIPNAWNRRFGSKFGKSYWNERREEYNEGMYVTSFKYIAKPFTKTFKEYREQQNGVAMAAFKTVFVGFKDLITNAKINWHLLNPMEKANIKRTAAEMTLLISAVLIGSLLKAGDDDDEKKNFLTVWGLYQCDRLYGELTTFTPMGVLREGNRLFDNPVASFRTFDSVSKLLWSSVMYPLRDEEENTFKSGIYHGREKVSVYFLNTIPIVNQIQKLSYLSESNQRYSMFK